MTSKLLERTLAGLLLVIAAGMVIHTPLTLWLGLQFPGYELLIKSWKELLMGLGLVLLIVIAVRMKKVGDLLADKLLQVSLMYAGLHFVMMMIFQNGLQTAGAGLLIDLRYVLYFVLVYGFIRLFPSYRRLFITVLTGGAVVVIGFALLQVSVLPKDFLAHIGYSKQTIAPYLTVDENHNYIRINSTLRGPNPLGAYVVIMIGLLTAFVTRWRLHRRALVVAGLSFIALIITLNAAYSRSSTIAVVVAVALVAFVAAPTRWKKRLAIVTIALGLVVIGGLFMAKDSSFVQNVILHDNPTTGSSVDSNAGHAESLIDGTERLIRQPFGAGIGSTGSASLIGDKPLIIENQYLLVAHEVGWIGLALFVWLYVLVMNRLWQRRTSALALGVFASGIGLAIIGLLLPVWTDDTVSIVWWGLAGVAVASTLKIQTRKQHNARKSN